jgi:hypothetical protein
MLERKFCALGIGAIIRKYQLKMCRINFNVRLRAAKILGADEMSNACVRPISKVGQ